MWYLVWLIRLHRICSVSGKVFAVKVDVACMSLVSDRHPEPKPPRLRDKIQNLNAELRF